MDEKTCHAHISFNSFLKGVVLNSDDLAFLEKYLRLCVNDNKGIIDSAGIKVLQRLNSEGEGGGQVIDFSWTYGGNSALDATSEMQNAVVDFFKRRVPLFAQDIKTEQIEIVLFQETWL